MCYGTSGYCLLSLCSHELGRQYPPPVRCNAGACCHVHNLAGHSHKPAGISKPLTSGNKLAKRLDWHDPVQFCVCHSASDVDQREEAGGGLCVMQQHCLPWTDTSTCVLVIFSVAQSLRKQNMTHQCSHERAPASTHASAHASVHESVHKSWLSLCYNPIQRLPLECARECSRGWPSVHEVVWSYVTWSVFTCSVPYPYVLLSRSLSRIDVRRCAVIWLPSRLSVLLPQPPTPSGSTLIMSDLKLPR